MKPKPATIPQLLATVQAYNTAHELHQRAVLATIDGKPAPNPYLENLYFAAAAAAAQLRLALTVPELKPQP